MAVCAGAAEDDPDTGYLYIRRDWLPGSKSKISSGFVPLSGAVRITHAPLGRKATKRVWNTPRIWFEGETGTRGYLDLGLHDESLQITGGPVEGVCPDGTTGTPPECEILRPYLSDFRVTPKVRWKRPGERFSFMAEVTNSGTAPAPNMNFCVETPPRFIKGKAWNCFVFKELPAGETARHRFMFKLTNRVKRGREYPLEFLATSPINDGYATWPGAKHAKRTIKILKR